MAQASSAQREPSMEEILASIRRIIEDNDAGRKQPGEPEQSRPAAQAPAERTVIEVDAFRSELRTPPAEASIPAPRETPAEKPVSLAEVQAQITAEAAAMPSRWMDSAPEASGRPVAEIPAYDRSPDDIKKAIELSRAAREDARALLGIPEPANTAGASEPRRSEPAPAVDMQIEERPAMTTLSGTALTERLLRRPRCCRSESSARWRLPSANCQKPSPRAAGRLSTRWPRR